MPVVARGLPRDADGTRSVRRLRPWDGAAWGLRRFGLRRRDGFHALDLAISHVDRRSDRESLETEENAVPRPFRQSGNGSGGGQHSRICACVAVRQGVRFLGREGRGDHDVGDHSSTSHLHLAHCDSAPDGQPARQAGQYGLRRLLKALAVLDGSRREYQRAAGHGGEDQPDRADGCQNADADDRRAPVLVRCPRSWFMRGWSCDRRHVQPPPVTACAMAARCCGLLVPGIGATCGPRASSQDRGAVTLPPGAAAPASSGR